VDSVKHLEKNQLLLSQVKTLEECCTRIEQILMAEQETIHFLSEEEVDQLTNILAKSTQKLQSLLQIGIERNMEELRRLKQRHPNHRLVDAVMETGRHVNTYQDFYRLVFQTGACKEQLERHKPDEAQADPERGRTTKGG
jgi:vacuolar-type H+-ATPase subunit I/STV1